MRRYGAAFALLVRPHNDLFVALAQAMGTTDTTFGDQAHVMGALPGLT